MALKRVALLREHTGDVGQDRAQRMAQQVAQKLNPITGRYLLVGAYAAPIVANVSTASASFADLTGLSLSLTAQVGDLLILDTSLLAGASAGTGQTRLAVVDGGYTYTNANGTTATTPGATLGGSGWYPTGGAATYCALSGLWTVRTSGTITAKVQALCSGGGTITVSASPGGPGGCALLRVQHLRAVA